MSTGWEGDQVATRDLIKRPPREGQGNGWYQDLVLLMLGGAGNLRPLSVEKIRSSLATLNPSIKESDIMHALDSLKQKGVVGERTGALGGRYWFIASNGKTAIPAERSPVQYLPAPETTPAITQPIQIKLDGDIAELFREPALSELVLSVFRARGSKRAAAKPGAPCRGTPIDAWAECVDDTLVLADCHGSDETVRASDTWALSKAVKRVQAASAGHRVEGWMVSMGSIQPDAEKECRDLRLRVVTPLELLRDALCFGILGIGMRSMRPYIARTGEHGVFLDRDELRKLRIDPSQIVRVE